jgi:hypothetical protein
METKTMGTHGNPLGCVGELQVGQQVTLDHIAGLNINLLFGEIEMGAVELSVLHMEKMVV